METNTRISLTKALKNNNSIIDLLTKDKTREQGIALLSEKSNVSVNFLTIHFAEVRRMVFELSM